MLKECKNELTDLKLSSLIGDFINDKVTGVKSHAVKEYEAMHIGSSLKRLLSKVSERIDNSSLTETLCFLCITFSVFLS